MATKPEGFEDVLGSYNVLASDANCGEPFVWGWPITQHLGEAEFRKLPNTFCVSPGHWGVADRYLTFEDAIKQYGDITKVITGPRGGQKYTVFGETKFATRNIQGNMPEVDDDLYEIEK